MERTERESDRRREMAGLLVLLRLAKSLQNGAGFRKNLNTLGLPKKKGLLQCNKVRNGTIWLHRLGAS